MCNDKMYEINLKKFDSSSLPLQTVTTNEHQIVICFSTKDYKHKRVPAAAAINDFGWNLNQAFVRFGYRSQYVCKSHNSFNFLTC